MSKRLMALLALGILSTVAVGVAWATMGLGVTATNHARGTIAERVKVKEVKNTDFLTQQIMIAPGGHTGWHSHPGAVLVIVKSGTFEYEGVGRGGDDDDDDNGGRGCFSRIYTAGQSFIDPGHGHVHIGRNVGTTSVELWATYTGIPVDGSPRIDAADPGC